MEKANKNTFRQRFHLEPPKGWLNDPNGLSFFGGEYQVYFQYSPERADGHSDRGWGHYHGKDLFDMKFDKAVLMPDIKEDSHGVYSGSAVVNNGVLHIFYTGNVKLSGDYDYVTAGREANVIHVTSADASEMSEKEVLLKNSDYPPFCSCHVRDPKVWKDGSVWKMVLGARTLEDKGCVLIYHSSDLVNWEYSSCVTKDDHGYMWECPDYFSIDGKGFLSVCPQGMTKCETKRQNLHQSGYFSVNGELENGSLGDFTEWDMGFDFYAPQTFSDDKGRRILIGWFGMDTPEYGNATTQLGWQHCLTLPREITVGSGGRLKQYPIAEFNRLRKNHAALRSGDSLKTSLPFDICAQAEDDISLNLDEKLYLEYDSKEKIFTMRFTDEKYGCGRTVRKAELEKIGDIRIIADMSGLEVYINGGETVMSTRFYPEEEVVAVKAKGINGTMYGF
ncbi:MAG: glycoside hydrolase family 32 protein [Oscillospiraceae bacterium]